MEYEAAAVLAAGARMNLTNSKLRVGRRVPKPLGHFKASQTGATERGRRAGSLVETQPKPTRAAA
ncbi:hypothetical protein GCM10027422_38950 [Hymenobacter arcticus]